MPFFTPSRTPLLESALDRRTAGVPLALSTTIDRFRRGAQIGFRWGHIRRDSSTRSSYFDGFNHCPTSIRPRDRGRSA